MQGKELINDMIYTYFMLVTMILGVMAVLGNRFMPDVKFGYEEFWTPLIYAAYGTLPNIIMYAKKELTMKQFLIRKAIQLVLIEVIILAVALPMEMFSKDNIEMTAALMISVFVIFILTHLIVWVQNCMVAKKMNEELILFQQNTNRESMDEKGGFSDEH